VDYFGTVEIRQHHGTLDFDEIEAWVWFGRHFIDRVAKTAGPLPTHTARELLIRTRTPAQQRRYLREKIAKKEQYMAAHPYGRQFKHA
jgi:hypothetical protein